MTSPAANERGAFDRKEADLRPAALQGPGAPSTCSVVGNSNNSNNNNNNNRTIERWPPEERRTGDPSSLADALLRCTTLATPAAKKST